MTLAVISNVVKFPARVTVDAPLQLTITGASYRFSLDVSAVQGGDVTVYQLRCALRSLGNFFTVNNHASFAVDPGTYPYEKWVSGGARTSYGDSFSTAIAAVIGAPATLAAYNLAPSIP
ncbi:hypothetical protein C4587_00980 [Candidatus Parcubacteria bacterium]|nr:MAG: hypothetical protein C4587_00980 [Candidatus Parcubacteria bacterium]